MNNKIKNIVEKNNCKYNGIQKGTEYNLILFTEPFFGSTLAIKEKEFTEEVLGITIENIKSLSFGEDVLKKACNEAMQDC